MRNAWMENRIDPYQRLYEGYTASQTSSSLYSSGQSSSSTAFSPTSSRGSKRSSTYCDGGSPQTFAPTKRRKLCEPGEAEGSCNRARNKFYLEDEEDEDDNDGFEGSWEIVQGAWGVSDSELTDDVPQSAPVVRVREMPVLQAPAPCRPIQMR